MNELTDRSQPPIKIKPELRQNPKDEQSLVFRSLGEGGLM